MKKLRVKIEVVERRAKELTTLYRELVKARGENPPGDVSEVAH